MSHTNLTPGIRPPSLMVSNSKVKFHSDFKKMNSRRQLYQKNLIDCL